jgi:hypothetical protein
MPFMLRRLCITGKTYRRKLASKNVGPSILRLGSQTPKSQNQGAKRGGVWEGSPLPSREEKFSISLIMKWYLLVDFGY